MKTRTIADAKNNLSQLIHQLDAIDVIHLTRHGKPVAVMLSETNYRKLTQKNTSVYQAIQSWRNQLDDECTWAEAELNALRAASQGREFLWGD
ncbi:hypothetical protein VZ94_05950 [Methylocucumis oryzae]|uniref:Antitoxin n=2 Tax=Methylocucumis oryzae TaxID=1632867 RepID=A0A0F3IKL0_9GAMM|nr:hypothetical protein VZ94_05950 [Methylocucumis oryzae]